MEGKGRAGWNEFVLGIVTVEGKGQKRGYWGGGGGGGGVKIEWIDGEIISYHD